ncbi:hypothetical protein [Diaphorobacter sp. ED-3]|uniref:hypothetical protein n=1 Tax=Diaphorobacter sp. ED-3 TaxID=3016636 RepID=UPI0022DD16B2|nr:hypothetical protein [Diaphorobacter sp. ED-3]
MHYINPRQASTEAASPIRERSYEAESSRLSESLGRLHHELQALESDLAPALEPAPGIDAASEGARISAPMAPLVEMLETYAAMANSMAVRVSELRSRLCFS